MKARKGYLKGMNKDGTRTKNPEESYHHLANFRVVTEEGNSTGSIENEKGHVLGFRIPNVPAATYVGTAMTYNIPAQNNLEIVGWGNLNDTIIVLTTNETSDNPSGIGQVWAFTYDESTGEIVDSLPGNVLDPNVHLKYNNKLKLSTEYRISRIVGRYENINTQRIYWTDYYNPVRTLNIADPNSLNLDPETLDLSSSTAFVQPVIWEVGNGALPVGTSIQFTYRLISDSGASSLFAPPTPIVPLNGSGYAVTSLDAFNGDGASTTQSRSVTIKIQGLDTNYQTIEYVAIHYSQFGVATAYKFDEGQVPPDGNVIKVCSTLVDKPIIPLIELNTLSSGFEVAKDIEVKDNILLAANTKSSSTDIDFDARAYRFDANREALLDDSDPNLALKVIGTTKAIVGINDPSISGTWEDIIEDHDCINRYNTTEIDGPAVWNNNQYKYMSDGVTLGGEGPNISYKFRTEAMMSTNNLGGTFPHITVNKITTPYTKHIGITNRDGSLQELNMENQFINMASYTHHCYFANHARGEVYRYAIAFYNKRGSLSFTKWIGDIKIPDVAEGFPIQNNDGTSAGYGNTPNIPWLQSLGIEFYVDVTDVADEISGFSIVRVLRQEADKTRLGTGMLMFYEALFDTIPYEDVWSVFLYDKSSTYGSTHRPTTSELEITGQLERRFIVRTQPAWGSNTEAEPYKKGATHLVSPLGSVIPATFKQGDYIKETGYYKAKCYRWGGRTPASSLNEHEVGFHYKLNSYVPSHQNNINFELRTAKSVSRGEWIGQGFGSIGEALVTEGYPADNLTNVGFGVIAGFGGPYDTWMPFSIGDRKLTMILSSSPSYSWMTIPANMQWYNNDLSTSFVAWNDDSDPATNNEVYFKQVSYNRFVPDQYGGLTYEDRSINQYYYIGHFQPKVDGINNYANYVFFGDTYVNYYDKEILVPYYERQMVPNDIFNTPSDDRNKISVAVCTPVESPINTEFRPTQQWAKNRNSNSLLSANYVDYSYNREDYNFAYNNYDFVNTKFFAKDFLLRTADEHPNRIWASVPKTNGELVDSWRVFQANEYTEVNGILGPINRILNWKEQLYFYQDRGIGTASINERSIVNDTSGQSVVLGTGGVLTDYRYISTETGTIHQHSVAATESAIYHYDARLKKIFQLTQGLQPLSDFKGMSSWFDNEVEGGILQTDKTLSDLGLTPIGVHATPDYRYNRVLFTFLGNKKIKSFNYGETYQKGDIVKGVFGKYYEFTQAYTYTTPSGAFLLSPPTSVSKEYEDTGNFGFTVSYSEAIQAFESFYDYVPNMYLQYGRRLISNSPFSKGVGYIHNTGEYGYYYDRKYYTSKLSTILGTQGESMKLFSNLSFYGEVTLDDNDVYDESFNRIRLYNDYQDTGTLDLSTSLKRRMRTWRYTVPRDNKPSKARIRNFWTMLDLEYDNNDNKRHIVHDIVYSYMPVSM